MKKNEYSSLESKHRNGGIGETSKDVCTDGMTVVYEAENENIQSFQQNKGLIWNIVTGLSVSYLVVGFLGSASFYGIVAFTADTIIKDWKVVEWLLLYMYSASFMFLAFMIILASLGKITTADHFKHRVKNSFIRGGVVVLGSGAVLYSCLGIIEEFDFSSTCFSHFERIMIMTRLLNLIAEISFIYIFTKVRINYNRPLAMLCRFMICHIIMGNMVTWFRIVVEEMLHEIHLVKDLVQSHALEKGVINLHFNVATLHDTIANISHHVLPEVPHSNDTHVNNFTHDTHSTDTADTAHSVHGLCRSSVHISQSLAPYLFPLTIEYSLLVSVMWLSIWENCGTFPREPRLSDSDTAHRDSTPADQRVTIKRQRSESVQFKTELKSGFKNSGLGFILGWMMFMYAVFVVIVTLYLIYTDTYNEHPYMDISYGADSSVSCFLLLGIPCTVYALRNIKPIENKHTCETDEELSEDEFHSRIGETVDSRLLAITAGAVVLYKILSLVSAVMEGIPLYTNVLVESIMIILTVVGQTVFLKYYLPKRVCTTQLQLETKPGRQGLELLRFTNVSHWILNTFVLKQTVTKIPQLHLYGPEVWTFISNLVQPLTILYYFHSMILYAERIRETYDVKHVKKTLGINTHIKIHMPIGDLETEEGILLVPASPTSGVKFSSENDGFQRQVSTRL